jgi:ribonuclease VapC
VIIIDTSAVIAMLNRETTEQSIANRLLQDTDRRITAVSSVEVVMVLARKYSDPAHIADQYFRQESIRILPVDEDQASWARHAFLTFGKGRHPARLNLGDCFSYAAAKALNAPLLYVGGDFAKTDIKTA